MDSKKRSETGVLAIPILVILLFGAGWSFFLSGRVAGFLTGLGLPVAESLASVLGIVLVSIIALISPLRHAFKKARNLEDIQQEFERERRGMELFLNTADTIFLVFDKRQEVQLINHKGCALLGYHRDKVLGRNWFNNFIPAKKRQQAKKLFLEPPKSKGEKHRSFTLPILTQQGDELDIEWRLGWLRDASGTVYGILCTGVEVPIIRRPPDESEGQIRKLSSDLVLSKRKLQHQILETENLRSRLNFWMQSEKLVYPLRNNIENLSPEQCDDLVQKALEKFGKHCRADSGYIFLFSADGETMDNTHIWSAVQPAEEIQKPAGITLDDFPWFKQKIMAREIIHISHVDKLPPQAENEKNVFKSQGILSFLNVPMVHSGKAIGYIGFESQEKKTWTEDDIAQVRILGEVFSVALRLVGRTAVSAPGAAPAGVVLPGGLLRNLREGVLVFDKELRVTEWNPRLEEISGIG